MCTVTIVPRVDGFRVACNRDERNSRPSALAPRRHHLAPRLAVFPTDLQSGGTWIGANDAGLVLALLNRTSPAVSATVRRCPQYSRGHVIPPLLEVDTLQTALGLALTLNPVWFEPFCLVLVQGRDVAAISNDGLRLSVDRSRSTLPLLFTSSSLGDEKVEEPRRRLFAQMVLGAKDSWLHGQRLFHRHRWPGRPELSVQMARGDARTVSRSVVDVRDGRVEFHYEPLESAADAA